MYEKIFKKKSMGKPGFFYRTSGFSEGSPRKKAENIFRIFPEIFSQKNRTIFFQKKIRNFFPEIITLSPSPGEYPPTPSTVGEPLYRRQSGPAAHPDR
jgi:hypothetical protein